ncbi:MAG: hypothetical protein Q8O67_21580 [Deltaproteobacteria bacterium]|nr:hypothetical protein [Deltaproteobacteria bacterium]
MVDSAARLVMPLLLLGGCEGGLERVDDACAQIVTGTACAPTVSGDDGAVQCFDGRAFVEPTACASFCEQDEGSVCTPVVDDLTDTAFFLACNCSFCAGDNDCGATEFCDGVCQVTKPGRFDVLSVTVSVPPFDRLRAPWDADSPPDLVVELRVDGEPWVFSPLANDSAKASWTFDAGNARDFQGNERLDVGVYDVDGAQRTAIEEVFFFRIGGVLSAGGTSGVLLDEERPTLFELRLAEEVVP